MNLNGVAHGRGEDDSYLFPSPRRKAHLSRQAIGDVCSKWGRAAGFHLHPHQLRHSHATHAIRRGCDVFVLAGSLGHASTSEMAPRCGGKPKAPIRHDLAEQAPTKRERSADYVPVAR